MKFISKRFDVDGHNGELRIDVYGDTHFGSKNVDESLLKRHIAETHERGNHWVFVGDGIDGILPSDTRRFDSKNVEDWAWAAHKEHNLISAEYDHWAQLFGPIANTCLFYIKGDGKHSAHENVADCRDRMLQSLGIPGAYQGVYYTFKCYRTVTSSMCVPLMFNHGKITGTDGNKINRLIRIMASFPEAWGVFVGHGHTKAQTPPQVSIVEREHKGFALYRRGAMTGSYLRTYADDTIGYGETAMYAPVALGRITIVLRPFASDPQRRIEIENA